MKLYYSPGACALFPQILLRETEQKFDLVKVDLKTKQTPEGDFLSVNPKGYVPALKLDSGEVLTEGAMLAQWIADQRPERKLLPPVGTMERYRAIEWLTYISAELHKGIGSLFAPPLGENEKVRGFLVEGVHAKLAFVNKHLEKNQYFMGASFSAPDAYAYTVMRWPSYLKIDISQHKAVLAYMERMESLPSVRSSLEAEGIPLQRKA